MFESLQDNLSQALRKITGQARLTESNMRDGLKLVERALLEADVSISVVREFMERVTEQAVGEEVLKSLRASDVVVKIVFDELVNLMGPVDHSMHLRDLTKIMLCGLQGSGKTTTCAKLARLLKQNGRKPMMVAADLQRPAAIHQLQVLGKEIGVPVHADVSAKDPVKLCQEAVDIAAQHEADVIIYDTAGRLHIDDVLMGQLRQIDLKVQPHQVYLVVDGMTGQDAVHSAKAFNEALELNGVIMTKLDGDARGGAVLSVKAVTGVPIKFLGTGEHLADLEPFVPEGMASRILGHGDLGEIARRAQTEMDQEELAQQQQRMMAGQFTLDDFDKLLGQMKKMGRMSKLIGLIPGMGQMKEAMAGVDVDQDMQRYKGMIHSMTADERRNPTKVIDQSRRRRIAAGSGVEPHEVNDLVKQFDVMADVMKRMAGKGVRGQMEALKELQSQAADPRGLAKQKKGSGKRLSPKQKTKLRKQREKEIRRQKRENRVRK